MGVIADFARRVQAEKLEAEKAKEHQEWVETTAQVGVNLVNFLQSEKEAKEVFEKLNDAPENQNESQADADDLQVAINDVVEDINNSASVVDDAATGINDAVAELKETVEETKK